jgi:hypothetical protein
MRCVYTIGPKPFVGEASKMIKTSKYSLITPPPLFPPSVNEGINIHTILLPHLLLDR